MGACARNMQSDPAEIKPAQRCIKLVFHLTCTMMHGSTKLKKNRHNYHQEFPARFEGKPFSWLYQLTSRKRSKRRPIVKYKCQPLSCKFWYYQHVNCTRQRQGHSGEIIPISVLSTSRNSARPSLLITPPHRQNFRTPRLNNRYSQ